MAQLNTRIVLRNDSLANWESNGDIVLLKGEFGVAFDTDGTPKIKIGDGIKTWAELDWFQDGSAPIEGVTNEQLTALGQELTTLASIVGTPATDTSSATGIYGEIAALAESMGLLVDDKIDAFANAITDDGKINTVMELIEYVDSHSAEAADLITNVNNLQQLVGNIPVQDQIALVLGDKGYAEKETCDALYEHVKYNISSVPYGTLVNYGEHEIRVMCPENTQWTKQTVGSTGNANMYYMAFKAYAPEGAVSFKEGDRGEIIDEMYTFDGDFSGTDEYGRNYSICWLALASCNESTGEWTYFGKNSSVAKYIGWNYVVEWYDADGVMIGADHVRINLSNEACHHNPEPYYMNNVVKEVVVNGVLCDVVNNRVEIELTGVVKSSDEINVNDDGTLAINKIDASKIVTSEGTFIVLNGGSASV